MQRKVRVIAPDCVLSKRISKMLKFYIISAFMFLFTTYCLADFPNLGQRDTARQDELRPRLEKIRKDHPRIFCHSEDFPEIRKRVELTPEIKEVYGWLLEWARNDHYYQNLWATPNQLIAACVAYRIDRVSCRHTDVVGVCFYVVGAGRVICC